MGGRGASAGGIGGGGGFGIQGTRSLISEREGRREEVDQTLTVLRDVANQYGVTVNTVVAELDRNGRNVMAYYASDQNLGVNKDFFDTQKMTTAYDRSVQMGFHPERGSKTAMEATIAHEMGHRLTDVAGQKAGMGTWAIDRVSSNVVRSAAKQLGYNNAKSLSEKISGYAKENFAETVAEAFADVYCNGQNAKRESHAVVNELNKYYK